MIYCLENGEYWRLLIDGEYEVTAEREGCQPATQQVTVQNNTENEAQILDFELYCGPEDMQVCYT